MPFVNGSWVPYTMFNGTTLLDMGQYINATLGGFFGFGILIVVFFVTFVIGSRYSPTTALSSSMFITTILAFLLASVDLFPDQFVIIFVLGLVASIILLFKGGGSGGV